MYCKLEEETGFKPSASYPKTVLMLDCVIAFLDVFFSFIVVAIGCLDPDFLFTDGLDWLVFTDGSG